MRPRWDRDAKTAANLDDRSAAAARLRAEMKAIITTFDDKAVTLTLATIGPIDQAEKERLYDLFRSSSVVDLRVGQEGTALITLTPNSPHPGSA